jgi:hypothetical protein
MSNELTVDIRDFCNTEKSRDLFPGILSGLLGLWDVCTITIDRNRTDKLAFHQTADFRYVSILKFREFVLDPDLRDNVIAFRKREDGKLELFDAVEKFPVGKSDETFFEFLLFNELPEYKINDFLEFSFKITCSLKRKSWNSEIIDMNEFDTAYLENPNTFVKDFSDVFNKKFALSDVSIKDFFDMKNRLILAGRSIQSVIQETEPSTVTNSTENLLNKFQKFYSVKMEIENQNTRDGLLGDFAQKVKEKLAASFKMDLTVFDQTFYFDIDVTNCKYGKYGKRLVKFFEKQLPEKLEELAKQRYGREIIEKDHIWDNEGKVFDILKILANNPEGMEALREVLNSSLFKGMFNVNNDETKKPTSSETVAEQLSLSKRRFP